MMPVLLWLVACGWEADRGPSADANSPEPTAAASTVVVTAEETELLREELAESQRQVQALDDRLSRLELLVAEMQEIGIGEADRVRYDPSRSELGGRSVQAALDELAEELDALQAGDGTGEPSDDLFQMHREDGPMGGSSLAPRNSRANQAGPLGGPQPRQGGPEGGKGKRQGPPDGQRPPN